MLRILNHNGELLIFETDRGGEVARVSSDSELADDFAAGFGSQGAPNAVGAWRAVARGFRGVLVARVNILADELHATVPQCHMQPAGMATDRPA